MTFEGMIFPACASIGRMYRSSAFEKLKSKNGLLRIKPAMLSLFCVSCR